MTRALILASNSIFYIFKKNFRCSLSFTVWISSYVVNSTIFFFLLHLIVVPQLSGGRQNNYWTQTRQAGMPMSSLCILLCLWSYHLRWLLYLSCYLARFCAKLRQCKRTLRRTWPFCDRFSKICANFSSLNVKKCVNNFTTLLLIIVSV
jgi:hypothetical protein